MVEQQRQEQLAMSNSNFRRNRGSGGFALQVWASYLESNRLIWIGMTPTCQQRLKPSNNTVSSYLTGH